MFNNPYNYMGGNGMVAPSNNMFSNGIMTNNQQPIQQQAQTTGLIKVTGIEGAKAYQMPPNGITALFDSSDDIFYVKTTDGAGFPTIKTYKFTVFEQEAKTEQATGDFVSREEFEQFKTEVMNNGKQSVSKRTTKDKSTDDE